MTIPPVRLGLTRPMISLMIKGAIPPTIAIASTQSSAFLGVYGNFTFIIAIASILSLHLLPRHRFLQDLALTAVQSMASKCRTREFC